MKSTSSTITSKLQKYLANSAPRDTGDLLLAALEALNAAEATIAEQQTRLATLESLASTDHLTGLLNRRGFEDYFNQEVERLRRHNSKGCLMVLVDLDHFKEINDLFGHQAGDACLKMVGRHLQHSVRVLDGIARLGGDEFGVLMTHTDPEKAAARVLKIKQVLDRMSLDWHGKRLHVGASFGIQQITAESDFETAYRAADMKMYGNKSERRAIEKPRPARDSLLLETLYAGLPV